MKLFGCRTTLDSKMWLVNSLLHPVVLRLQTVQILHSIRSLQLRIGFSGPLANWHVLKY